MVPGEVLHPADPAWPFPLYRRARSPGQRRRKEVRTRSTGNTQDLMPSPAARALIHSLSRFPAVAWVAATPASATTIEPAIPATFEVVDVGSGLTTCPSVPIKRRRCRATDLSL